MTKKEYAITYRDMGRPLLESLGHYSYASAEEWAERRSAKHETPRDHYVVIERDVSEWRPATPPAPPELQGLGAIVEFDDELEGLTKRAFRAPAGWVELDRPWITWHWRGMKNPRALRDGLDDS